MKDYEIYNKKLADRWQRRADIWQFGSIGGVFGMIVLLEFLPMSTAKIIVWPLATMMVIAATISYFVSRRALEIKMKWLKGEMGRIK